MAKQFPAPEVALAEIAERLRDLVQAIIAEREKTRALIEHLSSRIDRLERRADEARS